MEPWSAGLRVTGARSPEYIHISDEPEFLHHTGIACSRLESLSTAQVAVYLRDEHTS